MPEERFGGNWVSPGEAAPLPGANSIKTAGCSTALLVCERQEGDEVEVVAKFSANCDPGVTNLAREVIAACLAGDLGLPIPTPYLLDVTAAWAASVSEANIRANIQRSASDAFGSSFAERSSKCLERRHYPPPLDGPRGPRHVRVRCDHPRPVSALKRSELFVCGDEFRIFDHELAFAGRLILGWKPPWTPGKSATA